MVMGLDLSKAVQNQAQDLDTSETSASSDGYDVVGQLQQLLSDQGESTSNVRQLNSAVQSTQETVDGLLGKLNELSKQTASVKALLDSQTGNAVEQANQIKKAVNKELDESVKDFEKKSYSVVDKTHKRLGDLSSTISSIDVGGMWKSVVSSALLAVFSLAIVVFGLFGVWYGGMELRSALSEHVVARWIAVAILAPLLLGAIALGTKFVWEAVSDN